MLCLCEVHSCSLSPLNIGMTLAIFSLTGTIPREIDKFIKSVNGSRYESDYCFRIDAGSSS